MLHLLVAILITFASQTWLQALHITHHRADHSLLRGVSVSGLMTTILSEILWLGYASHFHLIGGLSNATLSLLSVCVILVWLYKADICTNKDTIRLTLVASTACMAVAWLPISIVIVLATLCSTVFLLPQTVKTARSIGSHHINGMSTSAIVMIICANTAWIVYGIIYHAWAYLISSSVLLTCGLIMAAAKWVHSRRITH